mgnify:FL=1
METSSLFGEPAAGTFVLTVPMRNGNDVYVKKLGQFIRVLTVPMRNGNTIHNKPFAVPFQGSYRTYEEWKRCICEEVRSVYQSSYRTYEEWKHCQGE